MVNIRHVIVAVVMAIAAPSSAGDLTDRAIEQMSSSQALGDSQGLGSIGNRDRLRRKGSSSSAESGCASEAPLGARMSGSR